MFKTFYALNQPLNHNAWPPNLVLCVCKIFHVSIELQDVKVSHNTNCLIIPTVYTYPILHLLLEWEAKQQHLYLYLLLMVFSTKVTIAFCRLDLLWSDFSLWINPQKYIYQWSQDGMCCMWNQWYSGCCLNWHYPCTCTIFYVQHSLCALNNT